MLYTPACEASTETLQIEIDGISRTLLLEPRNLDFHQLDLPKDSKFYSATLSDDPEVTARISHIDGRWQGLLLNRGSIQYLDAILNTTLDNVPGLSGEASRNSDNSVVRLTVKSLQQDSIQGTCAQLGNIHVPGTVIGNPGVSTRTLNLQSFQIPTNTFENYCSANLRVDGVCILAELTVAFDSAFHTAFGSSYQAQAAAIMDNVDFIYEAEFGIKFKRLTMEFENADIFDGSSDVPPDLAGEIDSPIKRLLWDMLSKRQSGATRSFDSNLQSILHLVTGRDFVTADSSAIGIANFPDFFDGDGNSTYPVPTFPVLCSTTADAIGLSQIVGSESTRVPLTALVVAHEIGHNFGFDHDGTPGSFAEECAPSTGDNFIMEPSLNSDANTFSPCSRAAIGPNIEALTAIEKCFAFPFKASIAASDSNPSDATGGTTINTAYDITVATRSDQLPTILVTGSVVSGTATFTRALLDNSAVCNLNTTRTGYRCQFNPIGTLSSHTLVLDIESGNSDVVLQHAVTSASADFFDIVPGDNQVVEMITVESIPMPPTAATIPSAGGSGGGGGTLGWQALPILLLLVIRRRTLA